MVFILPKVGDVKIISKFAHDEKVERSLQQRTIMQANPDLVDKLVVLRDVNGAPKIGVVQEVRLDGFSASVFKAKGRNYPADALIWVIGEAKEVEVTEDRKFMASLGEMLRQAQALRDTLMPFERRHALVVAGEPVNPSDLIPEDLPDGVTPLIAKLAIVLALGKRWRDPCCEGIITTPSHNSRTNGNESSSTNCYCIIPRSRSFTQSWLKS